MSCIFFCKFIRYDTDLHSTMWKECCKQPDVNIINSCNILTILFYSLLLITSHLANVGFKRDKHVDKHKERLK